MNELHVELGASRTFSKNLCVDLGIPQTKSHSDIERAIQLLRAKARKQHSNIETEDMSDSADRHADRHADAADELIKQIMIIVGHNDPRTLCDVLKR